MKHADLTGKTFGKLHVICKDEDASKLKGIHYWKCQSFSDLGRDVWMGLFNAITNYTGEMSAWADLL